MVFIGILNKHNLRFFYQSQVQQFPIEQQYKMYMLSGTDELLYNVP